MPSSWTVLFCALSGLAPKRFAPAAPSSGARGAVATAAEGCGAFNERADHNAAASSAAAATVARAGTGAMRVERLRSMAGVLELKHEREQMPSICGPSADHKIE